jgi:ubiquinone biosynthesis monooxygenase Coq7
MNKIHFICRPTSFCRLQTSRPSHSFFWRTNSSSSLSDDRQNCNDEYSPIIGDKRKRELMDKILRVDHAGEFGAQRIYAGQLALMSESQYRHEVEEMRSQELKHYKKMKELVRERRVRPSLLSPFWNVAGFLLGYGSALLGKEAAMACTVAVEEVITTHYNDQLREVIEKTPEDVELRQTLKEFRDDESEHRDIALKLNAEKAPLYGVLYNSIKAGVKLSLWIATHI